MMIYARLKVKLLKKGIDDVNLQTQDALNLFSAGHFFQFSNLRLHIFCKQNLEANVSKNNVFDVSIKLT